MRKYDGYTDLRQGIDRLVGMVKTRFRLDPFQNALFLFCGLRNDWINGLYWEEEGFVLLYKRLESGNFQWPRNGDEAQQLTPQQYRWLEEQGSERNFAAGGNGIERTLRRRAELMPGGSSMRRSMPCRRISGRARRCLPGWNTAISCSPGRSGSKTSPPEERTKQRPKEEKPILDALLVWADSVSAAPKSTLGKALHYLKEQWPYLLRYLEDERLESSNDRAECSIKPFVIDRKNFLFANTPLGAQVSVVIYSLIETAKETGLDPFRYLTWVLEIAPTLDRTVEDRAVPLLPANAPESCPTT